MALSRTRPTKLRLTLNFRTGQKTTEKIRGFALTLAQNVVINAADEMWQEIVGKVEGQIEKDVFREISRMAQLFKQYTIGISGQNAGPHATLKPASEFADGRTQYLLRTSWTPRSPTYLRRKKKKVGHTRWFLHSGLLSRTMGAGKFWTDTFGPVKVEVKRHTTMSVVDADRETASQPTKSAQSDFRRRLNVGAPSISGFNMRVNVASIRVAALDTITPQMLPALLNGDINNMPADGRETGLIRKFPKNIAEHLAGSSQRENFVPYRHTIEPFLGFYLTRAIPNAVMRRLQVGLGKDIRFTSFAGRGDQFADMSGL